MLILICCFVKFFNKSMFLSTTLDFPVNLDGQFSNISTAKKTQCVSTTRINLLTLFKEIIPVYTENHMKPIDTKCRVTC
jgi:hypothetical protein